MSASVNSKALQHSCRWQFATNGSPFREHRLCWNSNPNQPQQNPSQPPIDATALGNAIGDAVKKAVQEALNPQAVAQTPPAAPGTTPAAQPGAQPNPNAPQATPQQAPAGAQAAGTNVQTTQNQTATAARETIEDPDKPRPLSYPEKFRNAARNLDLTLKRTIQLIDKFGKDQPGWAEKRHELEDELLYASADLTFSEAVCQLQFVGDPDTFIKAFEQYMTERMGKDFQPVLDVIKAVRAEYGTICDHWETSSEKQREEVIHKMLKMSGINEMLRGLEGEDNEKQAAIESDAKEIEKISREVMRMNALDATTPKGLFDRLRKIRRYSLEDIYHGVKKYWEALHHAWEHQGEIKSSAIADAIGNGMRWLPFYGEETALQLNQTLRSKNREKTEQEKKHLEHSDKEWHELFGADGHGGLLHEYIHGANYDNARAVLEYAASRGWLYDIDHSMGAGPKLVFGNSIDAICADWTPAERTNYYTLLRTQNASGRESEIKKSEERIHQIGEVPVFIAEMERELNKYNLWAVVGIAQRAMDRGLIGEVAPWLATTVLEKLRSDPVLRGLADEQFFDKIGTLSAYNTAFTLGWLKNERKTLRRWTAFSDENYFESTNIGRACKQIEEDICRVDSSYEREDRKGELRQTVSQILTGQIVNVSGTPFCIFQNRYTWYRDACTHSFAEPADAYKEDSDYYIEKTEQWLNPENVYKKILDHTSTGVFAKEALAKPFITKLIKQAQDLKNSGMPDAYENYMREQRQKIDLWASGLDSHGAGVRITTTVLNDNITPAVAALYWNGLISENMLKKTPKLWAVISEQVKDPGIFKGNGIDIHRSAAGAAGAVAQAGAGGGGGD